MNFSSSQAFFIYYTGIFSPSSAANRDTAVPRGSSGLVGQEAERIASDGAGDGETGCEQMAGAIRVARALSLPLGY